MTEQNQRMDNRVKDWRDERHSLIQSQRHLLEKGLYSDVVVKIEGGETAGPVELEGSWRNGYSEVMNTDDHSKFIGFLKHLQVRVPISNAIFYKFEFFVIN
jgi:hypothetical protein